MAYIGFLLTLAGLEIVVHVKRSATSKDKGALGKT
jgi:hypothetical protein